MSTRLRTRESIPTTTSDRSDHDRRRRRPDSEETIKTHEPTPPSISSLPTLKTVRLSKTPAAISRRLSAKKETSKETSQLAPTPEQEIAIPSTPITSIDRHHPLYDMLVKLDELKKALENIDKSTKVARGSKAARVIDRKASLEKTIENLELKIGLATVLTLEDWIQAAQYYNLEGYTAIQSLNLWAATRFYLTDKRDRAKSVRQGKIAVEQAIQKLPPELKSWIQENQAIAAKQEADWKDKVEAKLKEAWDKLDDQWKAKHDYGNVPRRTVWGILMSVYPKDHPRYLDALADSQMGFGGKTTVKAEGVSRDAAHGVYRVQAESGDVREVVADSEFGAYMQYFAETGKSAGYLWEPACPKDPEPTAFIEKVGDITIKDVVGTGDTGLKEAREAFASKLAPVGSKLLLPELSPTGELKVATTEDLGAQVLEFRLNTQRGEKVFRALSEEQAIRLAEQSGLNVSEVVSSRPVEVSAIERYNVLKDAQSKGPIAYAEAAITYGAVLGMNISPDSIPVRVGEQMSEIALVSPTQASLLRLLPAYKNASGSDQDKLETAMAYYQRLPQKSLPDGGTIPVTTIKDENGNVILVGWDSIPERYRAVGEHSGLEIMINMMQTDVREAEEELTSAGFRCGERPVVTWIISEPFRTLYVQAKTSDEAAQIAREQGWKGFSITRASSLDESNQERELNAPNIGNYLKEDTDARMRILENYGFPKEVLEVIAKLEPYREGEDYDITMALLRKSVTVEELKRVGFEQEQIEKAGGIIQDWDKLKADFLALTSEKQAHYISEYNKWQRITGKHDELIPEDRSFDKLTPAQQEEVIERYSLTRPEYHKERAKATGKMAGQMAIGFVPVVGTVYYWDDMSHWQRALSIAGDVLVIAPIIGAAAHGARAAKGYTAGARMAGALKGTGKMVVAEVKAPIEFISNPIGTIAGVGKQLKAGFETIFHPKKIPLGSAEISFSTLRMPVDDVGDAARTMQLRDAVVDASVHGRQAVAKVGDTILSLTPTELQKVGGAMAIHSTPDIRPFLQGAVVGVDGAGDLYMAPNLHSRFVMATATGTVPGGGVQGALLIRDPDVLDLATSSAKLYRKAAEMEAVLPVGTKLPPPSQILYTSDIIGNRITILVIGQPFTAKEIAHLKFFGSLDTIGSIFKPSMALGGAQLAAGQAMDDLIDLSRYRAIINNQISAASNIGDIARVDTLRYQLTNVNNKITGKIAELNRVRISIGPENIVWGEYTETGLLERWAGLNPDYASVSPLGDKNLRKLPDIDLRQAVRRLERLGVTRSAPYTPRYSAPREIERSLLYASTRIPTRTPMRETLREPIRTPIRESTRTPLRTPMRAPQETPLRVPMRETLRPPLRIPIRFTFKYPVREPKRRKKFGAPEVSDERYGRIVVQAKMDGVDWEGPLEYVIEGEQEKLQGTRVRDSHDMVEPGRYEFQYQEGAPQGAIDYVVTPSRSRQLGGAETLTFTVEFSSKPIYEEMKEKRPGLTVKLPVVVGLGGLIDADLEKLQTFVGTKQEAIITPEKTETVGIRRLTPLDYKKEKAQERKIEKHGTASTYVSYPSEPLETEELSAEEFAAERPTKISAALWKKFGTVPGGVTTLGEGEEELLPFGVQEVRPVEKRIAIVDPTVPASSKLSKQAQRKMLGYERYYLGHKLREPELESAL